MKPKVSKRPTNEADGCCGSDCCGPESACCGMPSRGTCQVEAVVAVDARGQMVLPKEIREKFGVGADDRLAVVSWTRAERPCCITLLKVDELAEAVRRTYGPLLREIV